MNNTIPIENVADWFLSKEPMTHKKLQKLCYYAVAWGWALMGRNVTSNGRFEAWIHGPASPTLYRKYKGHGWNDIPGVAITPKVADDLSELLEAVWVTYGAKSGNELEAISHSEKPWRAARNGLQSDELSTNEISGTAMKDFYTSIKSTDY